MNIKPYQKDNQQAVIDLWQACKLVVPSNNPEKDIQRKMLVDPDLFLIGELAGEIVATVMGGYEGHRGWINYLAVSPDHQRKGYARAMMQRVEILIQEKGCPKINLQVRGTNSDVIKFYQAIGYDVENAVGLGKRLIPDD
ncbi:MAG: ribosomal protein S18 acetylase RimI-like enzyme [Gammaproteobacteria bacterium]|jgi:ribosomal protein S18 acetylase RimI-like enzyme